MEIRHSQIEDLDAIMAIYKRAREFMVEHDNPRQWANNNWPPIDLIKEDIAVKRSYVCVENEKIIGTFCFFQGYNIDATYLNIQQGHWSKDESYGVVHRVASDGTKGVGTFCLNWAYNQAGYLRIDTHPDNYVMQNLLLKLGFTKCGVIYVVEDNDPRFAFDK